MQEGKYRAKLVQYGFLSGENDPATGQPKPPQFFSQFNFQDETQANQKETWFGGFKELQPGKKISQREITLKTIKLLGYNGTQIAQLAAGVQSNLLNMEKEFEIELEHQKDAMGSVKVDANGLPRFRIKWVNDPENTGFKNQMKPQDATVVIGGLNLDAEMLALNNDNGQAAPGYNLNQGQPVGNDAQGAGQNQNLQNSQNQSTQPNTGSGYAQNASLTNNHQNVNQNQNQNVNQNVTPNFNQNNGQQMNNAQMGFDKSGNPPF